MEKLSLYALAILLRDAEAIIAAHDDPDDAAWLGQARAALDAPGMPDLIAVGEARASWWPRQMQ